MNNTDTLSLTSLLLTSLYLLTINVYYGVDQYRRIRRLGYQALVSAIIMAYFYVILMIGEALKM